MTTAIRLNCIATVLDGRGLNTSANLLTQTTSFQNQRPIQILGNLFANVANYGNTTVTNVLKPQLTNLGSGLTKAQWLIDQYPSNVTPVTSDTIVYYLTSPNNLASFANTFLVQANVPFKYGMQGFADCWNSVNGYVSSVFEPIATAYMLKGKTYAQSAMGCSGPQDLATGGLYTDAPVLSNAVSGWGTMYDVNNIGSFSNVYIFGQNLLNQGLGNYGNLKGKLSDAGLNTKNLLDIPQTVTTVTQQSNTISSSTSVGSVTLPVTTNVSTTTVVSGSSAEVLRGIYSTITGANLTAIVAATGITGVTGASTLADYLDINIVANTSTLLQLSSIGVTNFNQLGTKLQTKVGTGKFKSWADVVKMLTSIKRSGDSAPFTNPNANVLYNDTLPIIYNSLGHGTGPFENPAVPDFLGAVAGIPHTPAFGNINYHYSTLDAQSNLTTLTSYLDFAVTNYIATNNAWGGAYPLNQGNVSLQPILRKGSKNLAVYSANIRMWQANIVSTVDNGMWSYVNYGAQRVQEQVTAHKGLQYTITSNVSQYDSGAGDPYRKTGANIGLSFSDGRGGNVQYVKYGLAGPGYIRGNSGNATGTITSVGGGVYTITLTANVQIDNPYVAVSLWDGTADSNNYPTSSGNVAANVYNTQVEFGNISSTYVATTNRPLSNGVGPYWWDFGGNAQLQSTFLANAQLTAAASFLRYRSNRGNTQQYMGSIANTSSVYGVQFNSSPGNVESITFASGPTVSTTTNIALGANLTISTRIGNDGISVRRNQTSIYSNTTPKSVAYSSDSMWAIGNGGTKYAGGWDFMQGYGFAVAPAYMSTADTANVEAYLSSLPTTATANTSAVASLAAYGGAMWVAGVYNYSDVAGTTPAVQDGPVACVTSMVTPPVPTLITKINNNINGLSTSGNAMVASTSAYYTILTHLTEEVANLTLADISFGTGYIGTLRSFAERMPTAATVDPKFYNDKFFANLITPNFDGDTIKYAMDETANQGTLQGRGVKTFNNVDPSATIGRSQQQDIPLNTYLSRNK